MEKFRIINNKVWVDDYEEIWFKKNIIGIMGHNNKLFILTDPESSDGGQNVYAVSDKGKIDWQMQDPREMYNLDESDTRIFNIRFNKKNEVVASGYVGHGFVLDPLNGKIIGRDDTK